MKVEFEEIMDIKLATHDNFLYTDKLTTSVFIIFPST
jgi:hypothetical protein